VISHQGNTLDAQSLAEDGLDKVVQVARFLAASRSAVHNLMSRG
jgi:hypothetical protein